MLLRLLRWSGGRLLVSAQDGALGLRAVALERKKMVKRGGVEKPCGRPSPIKSGNKDS